jgi:hypothetical protein
MLKLLKDPLVHFLLIGACLFALSAWRGEWIRGGRERIVISADQVAQVRDAATLLKGRAPTDEEVVALIEPTIRDEVLYREALALKLDANDDEVRRRLVDKMGYLTQDTADPAPTSDAELRKFYDEAPVRFETPELASFDQVFFSPAARGDSIEADAKAGIAALRSGRSPDDVGDHAPVLFGDALAEAVFTLPPGDWTGPFKSDFGLHAMRPRARTARRLPPFDEIRDQVAAEFAAERRRERNEAEYRRMRAHYDVVIEKRN